MEAVVGTTMLSRAIEDGSHQKILNNEPAGNSIPSRASMAYVEKLVVFVSHRSISLTLCLTLLHSLHQPTSYHLSSLWCKEIDQCHTLVLASGFVVLDFASIEARMRAQQAFQLVLRYALAAIGVQQVLRRVRSGVRHVVWHFVHVRCRHGCVWAGRKVVRIVSCVDVDVVWLVAQSRQVLHVILGALCFGIGNQYFDLSTIYNRSAVTVLVSVYCKYWIGGGSY
jgi:hypothetical protein